MLTSTKFILTLLLWGAFLSCNISDGNANSQPIQNNPETVTIMKNKNLADSIFLSYDPQIEEMISKMSIEEKVGQLFMPDMLIYTNLSKAKKIELIKDYTETFKVGGFVLLSSDTKTVTELTNIAQDYSSIPLIISCDFEFGLGMRMKDGSSFPFAMALGAVDSIPLIYQMGKNIALEARAIGVHMNFAPVSDLNNNPLNPIINVRSFGENPARVGMLTSSMIAGMQDNKIIATAKHFPGHGNTSVDTHIELATIPGNKDDLFKNELVPFIDNINSGVMSVMVGHLGVSAFNTADTPATISHTIITKLLRDSLKFNGLIISDALDMKAITKQLKPGQAVISGIRAGLDIILAPSDPINSIKAVVRAVKNGELSVERIEQSVRRILLAKKWLGLFENKKLNPGDYERISREVNSSNLSYELSKHAITLVKDDLNLIPVNLNFTKNAVHISLTDLEKSTAAQRFGTMLSEKIPGIKNFSLGSKATKKEYDDAFKSVKNANVVFVSTYIRYRNSTGKITLNNSQKAFVQKIQKENKKVIMLAHGSPYPLMDFPEISTYLCNYSDNYESEKALIDAIFLKNSITGKLPVSLPGTDYVAGYGMDKNKDDRVSKSPKLAEEIEIAVNKAIKDSAFPGCVVLVQKGGNTLHSMPYGFMTYDSSGQHTDVNSIYDLASVTKVVATTTAIMILYERGLIKLEDTVSKFIPDFSKNGKGKITVKNLLIHNSGLKAYEAFYKMYKTKKEVIEHIIESKLSYKTGEKTVYSDFGVIMLGLIVEKVSGMSLDQFCEKEIFEPLEMNSTFYNPSKAIKNRVAPTEIDNFFRNRLLKGEVHDETAFMLEGIAGHAGLFSTVWDLSRFSEMMLNGGIYNGKQIVKAETIKLFTTKQNNNSSRALGWDIKTSENKTSGQKLSGYAFGHTGYTGTYLWIDPVRKLSIIFLSNRVYPNRSHTKITKFRTDFNDLIVDLTDRIN